MLYTRQSGKTVEWREHDALKNYLLITRSVLLIELNRILRSSTCSVEALKICFAVLEFIATHLPSPDFSFSETVLSLFQEHCLSFYHTLQSMDYTAHLYSVVTSKSVLFLRKMIPLLHNPLRLKNPFVLQQGAFFMNVRQTQQETQNVNSMRIGDEEAMGIYNFTQNVMIAEKPILFGKYIHSHWMVVSLQLCKV